MNEGTAETPAVLPEIPDKLYFKIGEVGSLLGVEPYVLRFWETEFPKVAPKKTNKGQRMYRRKDVELLLEIKHLLYEKKFTIEGARQHLHDESRSAAKAAARHGEPSLFAGDPLPEIRNELRAILDLLSKG
jgi:DNA-binding transcriptional MerR regulator